MHTLYKNVVLIKCYDNTFLPINQFFAIFIIKYNTLITKKNLGYISGFSNLHYYIDVIKCPSMSQRQLLYFNYILGNAVY